MAGKDRTVLQLISDSSPGQQTPEPADWSEVDDAGLLDAFSRTVVDVADGSGIGSAWRRRCRRTSS
jgi:hypothetical protein